MDIQTELQQLLAAGPPGLTATTIKNVHDFVEVASSRYVSADEVGEGYCPSIRVMWRAASVEVEIREGRYEVYRFFNHRTEIREFGPCEEGPPADLLDHLDAILAPATT